MTEDQGVSSAATLNVATAPAGRAESTRQALPEAAIRVGFGVIWGLDASLKWLPGFRSTYLQNLKEVAAGQPHWLAPWFGFWVRLEQPNPMTWAYLGAIAETLLAVFVILGVARKVVYLAGVGYSLLVWSTAGGFGGPYTPGATDIGPAIMYAVVFWALYIMASGGLTGRYSLDTVLARRIPWWHRIGFVSPGLTLWTARAQQGVNGDALTVRCLHRASHLRRPLDLEPVERSGEQLW